MKLVKNVVMHRYPFRVTFKDGRVEEITVEAESYHSAVYALPSGKRKYEYLGDAPKL